METPTVYYSSTFGTVTYNAVLTKFDDIGNLMAATYLGTSFSATLLSTDSSGAVYTSHYVVPDSYEPTFYASPGCFQPIAYGGISDWVFSKFTSDLSQRSWSTYIGGSGGDYLTSNEYFDNHIYLAGRTDSPDHISSPGSPQQTLAGGFDGFLMKFDTDGNQIWARYFGGTADDEISAIWFDDAKMYVAGKTSSPNLATPNAPQTTLSGPTDGFVARFDIDGNLEWCTYIGGSNNDSVSSGCPSGTGGFVITGTTSSLDNIATADALQPNLDVGNYTSTTVLPTNMFLMRFEPEDLATTDLSLQNLRLYPNPNNGKFTLKGSGFNLASAQISITDAVGRNVFQTTWQQTGNALNREFELQGKMAAGTYFVKVENGEKVKVFRMVVE